MGQATPPTTRSWVFKESDVRSLRESIPGKVFVSCHDSKSKVAAAGTTVVHASGSAADLDAIQARVHLHRMGGRVLDLSVDPATDIEGRILMEVFLDETHPLTSVESIGSSRVVLEDRTLAHSSVSIQKTGTGSVYVNYLKDFNVQELYVTLTGSGTIACIVPQLSVSKTLVATVQGSGGIRFHGNHISSASISCTTTGSGSTLFDVANLVSYDVVSTVVGSGTLRYAHAGSVDQHQLTLYGSGKIVTSALLANHAAVSVVGTGTIVTQAMEALHGSISGSGCVEYVKPCPKDMQVTTTPARNCTTHVKLTERKAVKIMDPPPIPTRTVEDDSFSFSGSFFGGRLQVNFNPN
ncbi:hypothetical protein H310_05519 [Aphanomyces invadans]|uniref:Putative auto-transporter adhesin head GIN domain-containing protein n=1 Tax=Aphanomyces invadans TaxID=157072 RepID=A0A024UBT1_9STRA|nr:hypothetical protein H310_05519 [Aphanomyces invadans]ETW03093.1 hypothetical protein H310_05519 [Aphanomyces invadans]|eukprot:XP_008868477.1 hypothetical protein H310_05519 [Aphanomyces invadans]